MKRYYRKKDSITLKDTLHKTSFDFQAPPIRFQQQQLLPTIIISFENDKY